MERPPSRAIVFFVQHQVMDGALRCRSVALRLVTRRNLVAAPQPAMNDVGRAPCRRADLVNDVIARSSVSGGRERPWARQSVDPAALTFAMLARTYSSSSLCTPAVSPVGATAAKHSAISGAGMREPLRVRAEGRKLKGGDSPPPAPRSRGALVGIDCTVQGEIDPRLLACVNSLALYSRRRADEIPFVIRHVDDRCDATRRRGAGGPDEVLLVFLRQRMDLRVDSAGQDESCAETVAFTRRGRGALPNFSDLPVQHRDIAVWKDAVRQDHGAAAPVRSRSCRSPIPGPSVQAGQCEAPKASAVELHALERSLELFARRGVVVANRHRPHQASPVEVRVLEPRSTGHRGSLFERDIENAVVGRADLKDLK